MDDKLQAFNRKPTDAWFLVPPEQFIYTHLPEKEGWQLLPDPVSPEDFDQLPKLRPPFFEQGHTLMDGKKGVFTVQDSLEIQVNPGAGYYLSGGLMNSFDTRLENFTLTQSGKKSTNIKARFPVAGDYRLVLFSRAEGENTGTGVAEFFVKAESANEMPFPETYGLFTEKRCRILKGEDGTLASGRPTSIEIKVPEAKGVYLKNGGERVPFDKNGDTFQLNFTPNTGEAIVQADFGDSMYQYLVRYKVE